MYFKLLSCWLLISLMIVSWRETFFWSSIIFWVETVQCNILNRLNAGRKLFYYIFRGKNLKFRIEIPWVTLTFSDHNFVWHESLCSSFWYQSCPPLNHVPTTKPLCPWMFLFPSLQVIRWFKHFLLASKKKLNIKSMRRLDDITFWSTKEPHYRIRRSEIADAELYFIPEIKHSSSYWARRAGKWFGATKTETRKIHSIFHPFLDSPEN